MKLMRDRGNHTTCSLCIQGDLYLSENSPVGPLPIAEREIVMKYRRLHLEQQMNERRQMRANELEAE